MRSVGILSRCYGPRDGGDEDARRILEESAEIGELLNDEEEDEIDVTRGATVM